VSEQLEDPFKSPSLLRDVLVRGKQFYDALTKQPDFRSAQLVIGNLKEVRACRLGVLCRRRADREGRRAHRQP
jgi:hypothetical protein